MTVSRRRFLSHRVSSPGDTSSCSSLLRRKVIPYCMFWKKSVFCTERSLYMILRNFLSRRMSGVPTCMVMVRSFSNAA